MFDPINRIEDSSPKLYNKIIANIRTMMQNGKLKAGEKIPTERELANMFQVSRVPVREALKTLEFIGVLQNVRGEGMYVRNVSAEDLLDKMDFVTDTSSDTITELFEVRETLEVKAVKLAAQRRTEKDIQKLRASIDRMARAVEEGKDVYLLAGSFHKCIFEAAKNKVLLGVNEYLVNLLNMSRKMTLRGSGRAKNSLDFHKIILDGIIARDEQLVAKIMREHIQDAQKKFKESFQNLS